MAIRYTDQTVVMDGVCTIEEVDGLISFLERTPGATVSLQSCEHVHTAIVQVLISHKVKLQGEVYSPFLWKWVAPLLAGAGGG